MLEQTGWAGGGFPAPGIKFSHERGWPVWSERGQCLVLPIPLFASSRCWVALQSPHAPFHPIPSHRLVAASTQHATAQASEVITQRQGMHLRHVYLHVSKMQGWKRCFSPLCLYSGATKGHTSWSIPHSSCNRACKSFVVAVRPGDQQCFQLPMNLESTACLSACLQETWWPG